MLLVVSAMLEEGSLLLLVSVSRAFFPEYPLAGVLRVYPDITGNSEVMMGLGVVPQGLVDCLAHNND